MDGMHTDANTPCNECHPDDHSCKILCHLSPGVQERKIDCCEECDEDDHTCQVRSAWGVCQHCPTTSVKTTYVPTASPTSSTMGSVVTMGKRGDDQIFTDCHKCRETDRSCRVRCALRDFWPWNDKHSLDDADRLRRETLDKPLHASAGPVTVPSGDPSPCLENDGTCSFTATDGVNTAHVSCSQWICYINGIKAGCNALPEGGQCVPVNHGRTIAPDVVVSDQDLSECLQNDGTCTPLVAFATQGKGAGQSKHVAASCVNWVCDWNGGSFDCSSLPETGRCDPVLARRGDFYDLDLDFTDVEDNYVIIADNDIVSEDGSTTSTVQRTYSKATVTLQPIATLKPTATLKSIASGKPITTGKPLRRRTDVEENYVIIANNDIVIENGSTTSTIHGAYLMPTATGKPLRRREDGHCMSPTSTTQWIMATGSEWSVTTPQPTAKGGENALERLKHFLEELYAHEHEHTVTRNSTVTSTETMYISRTTLTSGSPTYTSYTATRTRTITPTVTSTQVVYHPGFAPSNSSESSSSSSTLSSSEDSTSWHMYTETQTSVMTSSYPHDSDVTHSTSTTTTSSAISASSVY